MRGTWKTANALDCLMYNALYTREQSKMSFINFIFKSHFKEKGCVNKLISSI